MTKIGILALQGAFAEHEQVLKALGVETVQIRNRQDWEAHANLDGLILPGGESTVMGKLLHDLDLFEPIKEKIDAGLPVFGTCAGLIFVGQNHSGGPNKTFGKYGHQCSQKCLDANWAVLSQMLNLKE